jgi:PIN domain nuclease of toxin-antitoxin system
MQLLLDTRALLWWIDDAKALSERARSAIANANKECFFSLASCWKIAIKCSLGKLTLTQPVEQFIPDQLFRNGIRLLAINFRHVARVTTLPFLHRDPFDRLLVAQASSEKMTLVTADAAIARYDVKCLW